jgi:hypothetical protein
MRNGVIALVIGCSNFDAVQAQVFLHMGYVNANPRDDSGRSVIAPIRLGAVRQLLGQSAVAACGLPFPVYPDKQTIWKPIRSSHTAGSRMGMRHIRSETKTSEEGIARRPMQERAITAVRINHILEHKPLI